MRGWGRVVGGERGDRWGHRRRSLAAHAGGARERASAAPASRAAVASTATAPAASATAGGAVVGDHLDDHVERHANLLALGEARVRRDGLDGHPCDRFQELGKDDAIVFLLYGGVELCCEECRRAERLLVALGDDAGVLQQRDEVGEKQPRAKRRVECRVVVKHLSKEQGEVVDGVVDEHALVVGVAEVVAVQRLPKVAQRTVAHRAQRLVRL